MLYFGEKSAPERLFLKVSDYHLPASGHHFVIGTRIDSNEPVRVRLTTIAERLQDRPKLNSKKLRDMYADRRMSVAQLAAKSDKYISFDDAVRLADGEYRAHWSKVIHHSDGRGQVDFFQGWAHVALSSHLAHANLYCERAIAQPETIEHLWHRFMNTGSSDAPRHPHLVIRVYAQHELLAVLNLPPTTTPAPVFNPAIGETQHVHQVDAAGESLRRVLSGDLQSDFALDYDCFRAIYHGLKGARFPLLSSGQSSIPARIYQGCINQELSIEFVSFQRMDFAHEVKKTYQDAASQAQMKAFSVAGEVGYMQTFFALRRNLDAPPSIIFAAPISMKPKSITIEEFNP